MIRGVGGVRKSIRSPELIGQRVRVRVTMLRFYGCSGRFHRKRPALFKSGQWHIQQSTTPSLSQTI